MSWAFLATTWGTGERGLSAEHFGAGVPTSLFVDAVVVREGRRCLAISRRHSISLLAIRIEIRCNEQMWQLFQLLA